MKKYTPIQAAGFFFLTIIIMMIISFSYGCVSRDTDDESANGTSQSGQSPGNSQDQPESTQPDEALTPRQTSVSGDTGNGRHAVTGFEATMEQPTAPPAQSASGSENAPDGEVSMWVSWNDALNTETFPLVDNTTITASDHINLQVTVVNKTESTVTWVFPTGQKLDAVCRDEAGNEIYRWSNGLRFTQVLTTLELEPGGTFAHEITVILGDIDRGLTYGTWDVTVELTGTPSLSYTATGVTFEPGP